MVVTAAENRTRYQKFGWLSAAEEFERTAGRRNDFRARIGARNGLIFIENYWRNANDEASSHIDLWHGTLRRTKNELFYRGRGGPFELRFDDVAERVMFWEI